MFVWRHADELPCGMSSLMHFAMGDTQALILTPTAPKTAPCWSPWSTPRLMKLLCCRAQRTAGYQHPPTHTRLLSHTQSPTGRSNLLITRHQSASDTAPHPPTAVPPGTVPLTTFVLFLGCLCLPDSANTSISSFPRTFMCEDVQTNCSNDPTSRLNEKIASHKSLWPFSFGGMFARRTPCARPARYFSINYPDFSPRFTLSWRSPPSRPRCTAHLPYKACCIIKQYL